MINYIFFLVFTIINTNSIFIYNINNAKINGNLNTKENFSNNTININNISYITCNNINFENIFNILSSGKIIFNNIMPFNSLEENYLIGLNQNKYIIKNILEFNIDKSTLEKTISNINGLNEESLTFQSPENNIFIGNYNNHNLIINCKNLSLNYLFANNIIFNNTINGNNTILFNNILCNNFIVNNGLIFIKSPTNINAYICNINNIESKNSNSLNFIKGNITINNPINQIKSIIVNPINTPSNNLICLTNNNEIAQTQKITNFALNTNTISNPNSIIIYNIENIFAENLIDFNNTTVNLNTLNSTVLNLNLNKTLTIKHLNLNTLVTTNQAYISRYCEILNYCAINLPNKPITFLIDCNKDNSFLLQTVLTPNTYFFNLQGTSNYSYNLGISRDNNKFIFKYPPALSIKNKNNNIIKKILYEIYTITKEIKNNYQNIKNSIELYKKEYKKFKKFNTENEIISENLTLLLNNYLTIKETLSIKEKEEIETILLQLSEMESTL